MTGATAFPLVRGLIFLGLLLLIGTVVSRMVARPLLAPDDPATPVIEGWWRRLPGLLAWFILAGSLARGALQVLSFTDPGQPIHGDLVRAVLLDSGWGIAWMVQSASAFILLGLSWKLQDQPRVQYQVAGGLAVLMVVAQSGMGHGADAIWPAAVGRASHFVHLMGGGIWLGTLAILTIAVFPSLHGATLAHAVRRFSVPARIGALAVVATGVAGTLTYTRTLSDLIETPWGRLLSVKLVLLLGVFAAGWWNWRVITPALSAGSPPAPRSLRRAVTIELALAVTILVATAYLVGTATPNDLE